MPHPKVKISDNSGNEVYVTSNALDVNIASGTADIDIGDVSLLLDGTAADYGTGNVNTSGRTLRVTLASDDVHFGAVGAASDADGVIHGQLRYIGNSIANISGGVTQNQLRTSIEYTIKSSGSQYAEGDNGHPSWAVRKDTLTSLVSVDNDYTPLQVNASGALYVEVASSAALSVTGTVDLGSTDNAVLDAIDTVLDTIKVDTEAIETAVELIGDAIYVDDADFTSESNKGIAIMGYNGQNSITSGDVGVIAVDEAGQVRTVNNLGVLDTFVMIDVDNAAEQLSATVGVVSDCIEMFFQADESNSGYVIIGDSDVTDNRGIKLNAGDTFILNAIDTRSVYLWGSAADQNVRCMVSRSII